MSLSVERLCRCKGQNPKCYVCDGFGYVQEEDTPKPRVVGGLCRCKGRNPKCSICGGFGYVQEDPSKGVPVSSIDNHLIQQARLQREKNEAEKAAMERLKKHVRNGYRCMSCNWINSRSDAKCALCGALGQYTVSYADENYPLK